MLRVILGGAALQHCDNCMVFNSALATEVTLSTPEPVFPQPASKGQAIKCGRELGE
jgi:hypothetical protein